MLNDFFFQNITKQMCNNCKCTVYNNYTGNPIKKIQAEFTTKCYRKKV